MWQLFLFVLFINVYKEYIMFQNFPMEFTISNEFIVKDIISLVS